MCDFTNLFLKLSNSKIALHDENQVTNLKFLDLLSSSSPECYATRSSKALKSANFLCNDLSFKKIFEAVFHKRYWFLS